VEKNRRSNIAATVKWLARGRKHHGLKETNMNRRVLFLLIIASLATALVGQWIYAQGRSDHQLIKGVTDAKVTLQQGLTAAAQQGRPISAKFEVEDGKFQLSVYTAKDGKFSEVIVDHATGKVTKTESITEGQDLAEAKSQSAAMAKAKTDLKAAVDKSAATTSGSRAISVTPALKDGHPVASVILVTGQQFQTVEQPLE
jgi:hypothetical protein